MKKNLIITMTAVAILASSTAVFADAIPTSALVTAENAINEPAQPDTPFENEIQGDIMLISENPETATPVSMPSYISNTVIVTDITDESILTTTNAEDAENPENTINYTISDNTLVFGYADGSVKSINDIKKGDSITVYSNSYAPVPLILPPQYQANVIFVEDNAELNSMRIADVDTYFAENEMFVNAANTLALNINETTEIVDREGKNADIKDLYKKDLAVIYSTSTKSIPAQTTPIKVVVLGENKTALAQIEAAKNEAAATPAPTETPVPTEVPDSTETPAPEETPEVTEKADLSNVKEITVGDKKITNVYTKDNTLMVPLREIAETLDFDVEWNGEMREVILNSGIYSIKIDENSYMKGKMMPMELSFAPEIKDDLTYVPAEYFTDILEVNMETTTENDVITSITFSNVQ